MTAIEWVDSPESRARLGDLECKVLDGSASQAEVAEYRQLAGAHEAWLVTTSDYLAFCKAIAERMKVTVAEFTALATEPIRRPS